MAVSSGHDADLVTGIVDVVDGIREYGSISALGRTAVVLVGEPRLWQYSLGMLVAQEGIEVFAAKLHGWDLYCSHESRRHAQSYLLRACLAWFRAMRALARY